MNKKECFVGLIMTGMVVGVAYNWYHAYCKHKEPPPTYSIVCDHKGHYTWKYGSFVASDDSEVSTSRQYAINRAWVMYKIDQEVRPPDLTLPGPWYDCEGNDMEKPK